MNVPATHANMELLAIIKSTNITVLVFLDIMEPTVKLVNIDIKNVYINIYKFIVILWYFINCYDEIKINAIEYLFTYECYIICFDFVILYYLHMNWPHRLPYRDRRVLEQSLSEFRELLRLRELLQLFLHRWIYRNLLRTELLCPPSTNCFSTWNYDFLDTFSKSVITYCLHFYHFRNNNRYRRVFE